jgi:hypothetical protein
MPKGLNLAELERRVVQELRMTAPFSVRMTPTQIVGLVAAMQVAFRHPDFPETTRTMLMRIIARIRAAMPPAIAQAIDLGYERAYDLDTPYLDPLEEAHGAQNDDDE